MGAIGDEEFLAGGIEGEGVGLRAEEVAGILPGANGLDDVVGARVNDAQSVAAGD